MFHEYCKRSATVPYYALLRMVPMDKNENGNMHNSLYGGFHKWRYPKMDGL
jgi:hypothetical protein